MNIPTISHPQRSPVSVGDFTGWASWNSEHLWRCFGKSWCNLNERISDVSKQENMGLVSTESEENMCMRLQSGWWGEFTAYKKKKVFTCHIYITVRWNSFLWISQLGVRGQVGVRGQGQRDGSERVRGCAQGTNSSSLGVLGFKPQTRSVDMLPLTQNSETSLSVFELKSKHVPPHLIFFLTCLGQFPPTHKSLKGIMWQIWTNLSY